MSLPDSSKGLFFLNMVVISAEAMEHFINPQRDVNKNIPLFQVKPSNK